MSTTVNGQDDDRDPIRRFTAEETERMRREMTESFAPATTFEEAGLRVRRPKQPGRVVHGEQLPR